MAQLGRAEGLYCSGTCVFIDIGDISFRNRPHTRRGRRIFTSVRIMNIIDNKEDMPERENLEETINGSSMEVDLEAGDSGAPGAKEEAKTKETEAETMIDPGDDESVKQPEPASEETEKEEAGSEPSESVPSIEEDPVAEEAEDSKPAKPAAEKKSEKAAADDDDSDGEHKIDIGRAKWYTIRTFSGQEKKIRESLLATIQREKMDDKIFEILVPTENVVEMRDGKKRSRVKVFFPGYVLVQMDLDKETQYLIEEHYGVLNFIGPGNNPQELKETELRRILGDSEERKAKNLMAAPYAVGDSIKVVDGPFNDFSGYVQEINEEKQKVKVMVSIFGRATPVELDFLQVALEK